MKKFLICGAAGMVGRSVITEISKTLNGKVEVWAADMFSDSLEPLRTDFIHPILNEKIEAVLQENQIDVMLQMAFPRNVKPEQWADGIRFAANIFSLAQKYDVKRVINISSQSIYGLQRTQPADENTPISLNSPYTTGKYCTELMMELLFADKPHANVRLSTIIAPTSKERVVNKFINKILNEEDINVQGGAQIFSFLDVRDAATGLVAMMYNENSSWRPVYNLGTAESKSLLEIANMAVEIGRKYGYTKTKINLIPEDSVLNNQIIVSAIKEDIGWEAKFTLYESMEYIFNLTIA